MIKRPRRKFYKAYYVYYDGSNKPHHDVMYYYSFSNINSKENIKNCNEIIKEKIKEPFIVIKRERVD